MKKIIFIFVLVFVAAGIAWLLLEDGITTNESVSGERNRVEKSGGESRGTIYTDQGRGATKTPTDASMICKPLYSNHNNKNADRINILLIGAGYDSIDDFLPIAKNAMSLGVETPTLYTSDEDGEVRSHVTLDYGLFQVEPFLSNKDKFNVWYLSEISKGDTDNELLDYVESRNFVERCEIGYVYKVFFYDGILSGSRFTTHHATFPSFKGDRTIHKENIEFGTAFLNAEARSFTDERRGKVAFIHETGHALAGLVDTPNLANKRTPRICDPTYPNCAPSRDRAEYWWGKFAGEVDPFFYTYRQHCREVNCTNMYEENDVKVQTHEYKTRNELIEEEVVYSTRVLPVHVSTMSDPNFPVFGAVNRSRIEQVLDLFSGK